MSADQDLHGLADALPEHLGEFGLALARVAYGLQQCRSCAFGVRGPRLGVEEDSQRRDLLGKFAFLEPEVDVPVAPRLEIQTGEQQAPVATVREEREMLVAGAQIANRLAHEASAPAKTESFAVVDEHG